MAAYIIVEVEIKNPADYEQYKRLTPGTLSHFGGKFIVRGAEAEVLEGDWSPQRVVVLEFPSVEKAKEWWHSEEYAKAKHIRQQSAKTKMIVIEGYTG